MKRGYRGDGITRDATYAFYFQYRVPRKTVALVAENRTTTAIIGAGDWI